MKPQSHNPQKIKIYTPFHSFRVYNALLLTARSARNCICLSLFWVFSSYFLLISEEKLLEFNTCFLFLSRKTFPLFYLAKYKAQGSTYFSLLFKVVHTIKLHTFNKRSKHIQIIDLSFVKREMTLSFWWRNKNGHSNINCLDACSTEILFLTFI